MATTHTTIDLWRNFRPFDTQRRFLESTAKYRLLSSGYGGGKTALGCRESIRHAVQHPGSINAIFRDTGTNLRDTTMQTFWREARTIGFQENTHYTYNKQDRIIRWWNNSETWFRHFEDVEALGSIELSTAFIDEGSEVADDIYAALFPGRLRAHLPDCDIATQIRQAQDNGQPTHNITCACPQRAWICTNPGASGYLKQVINGQMGPEWEWFPVKPGENPYNGPAYYNEMRRKKNIYGDAWYRRYYEGSWDAFEGQRFTMFDRDKHILPTPFRPDPNRYDIIEGWDFGHRETFIVWIAADPNGQEPNVVFHELKINEVQSPQQVANAVKRIRDHYRIHNTVRALGDPAGIAANQFSAISPITAYAQLGIYISPCRHGKNPLARADVIAKWLTTERRQPDGTTWPGLVFNPTCPHVVDSLTSLRWKNTSNRLGEEPREAFIKINDHGFDALGYGILGITPPTETPPPPPNDPWGPLTPPQHTPTDDDTWITI